MRFCMVTTFYPPYHFGGDATYVKSLSDALVEMGHQVEIIHCEDAFHTVNHAEKEVQPIIEKNLTIHRLKNKVGFLSPLYTQQTGRMGWKKKQIKSILSKQFDVVHFHNISLVGGPEVLHYSNAPITLYTMHEHWLICPTHILWKNKQYACDKPECIRCVLKSGIPPQLWRYTKLLKNALTKIDQFLSPSEFTAEQHRKLDIYDKTQVVPLFSNLSPDYQPWQQTERPLFLFVGRVTDSKGIRPLLKEMSKRDDVDLLIVGSGECLAELKSQYQSFRQIQFLGHVEQYELLSLYQKCTALLFPSLAPETFGLTIVEAFACGAPAIVRKSGGSTEIINNSKAGFIYQTDDELHSAINQLIKPEIRKALGAKARKAYEKYYTKTEHLNHYLRVINKLQVEKGVAV